MIQDKQLLGLGVAALVLLILTILVYSVDPTRERAFQRGTPLVQGVSMDAIGGIEIERDGETLRIVQRGNQFQVREMENYPVDRESFNRLLFQILDLRASDRMGAGEPAAKHFGFGVQGTLFTQVRLLDKQGEPLMGLEFAAPAGSGTSVRREGRPEVFATESPVRINADVRSYVNTELLDIRLPDLRSIVVEPTGDVVLEIVVDQPQPSARIGAPTPRLVTVEEGELLDSKALTRFVTEIRSVDFDTPRHPGTLGEVDWLWSHTLKTDKVTYRLRLGEVDDMWVCAVSAEGPTDKEIQAALQQVRSGGQDASMRRADELIQARQVAEEYTRHHAPWVYTLPDGKREALQVVRGDLLQDPDNPTSIGARHILIAHADAERSRVDRTREEAEALATEVLALVGAEGADFAELARTHSDDPGSGASGGDLGMFGRRDMAEAFDKAAFGLKVGEVSGIVETPFGFHIIERTK